MRPTPAGTGLAAGAVVLVAVGLLVGLPELTLLGVAGAVVLVVAATQVALGTVDLRVGREPRPRRVALGGRCDVALRVRNEGRRRSPVVRLVDGAGRHGRVVLSVAPLAPRAARETFYRLPTTRRGEEVLGPLTVEREDPFGLFRRTMVLPGTSYVLVRPEVVPLAAPGPAPDDDPDGDRRLRVPHPSADEDLAGLRPYVPGDDVRRVHWRTTARTGTPVVRHHDVPQRRRTTVLVDVRRDVHDDASFERAMTAAASVAAAVDDGDDLRVLTTDGADTGLQPATTALEPALDLLARAAPSSTASLARTLADLDLRGRVVLVLGALTAAEEQAVGTATASASWVCRVRCGTEGPAGAADVVWDGRTGDTAAQWRRAVDASRARAVR